MSLRAARIVGLVGLLLVLSAWALAGAACAQPPGTLYPSSHDTDGDCLSDELELEYSTDPASWDTDGDGLGDYDEIVKYKTNPLSPDSDNDGTMDSDWAERREFTYSILIDWRLRPPFSIASMSDAYQDSRIVEGEDADGYSRILTIIYPETRLPLSGRPFPTEETPQGLAQYTQPGYTTSVSESLQEAVRNITKGSVTDVNAVSRIVRWIDRHVWDLPCSVPAIFFTYSDGEDVRLRNYVQAYTEIKPGVPGCSTIPPQEDVLTEMLLADRMFDARKHSGCTGVASLTCSMIRAAGIPCRLVFVLYPDYYHEDQTAELTVRIERREWTSGGRPCVNRFDEGFIWMDHGYVEAWLGGQWVRIDHAVNVMYGQRNCLVAKILAVHDWLDVDFSRTYPTDWAEDRPYYTTLIADQEPVHASVD